MEIATFGCDNHVLSKHIKLLLKLNTLHVLDNNTFPYFFHRLFLFKDFRSFSLLITP